MNIITLENVSKSFGDRTLFSDVSLIIEDNDKIGLIGINGTGKSTLLKLIADVDSTDTGSIKKHGNVSIQYLSQEPEFDPLATVIEQVFKSESEAMNVVREYEVLLDEMEKNPSDESLQNKFTKISSKMDSLNAWELESKVKTVLTKLGISDFNKKMGTLSGGQKKRVALASCLISPSELLILDEPTNHMDNETIEWLESFLKERKNAVLMITHDRYFLDRVVKKTIELDCGTLHTYSGNYSEFLEKKAERKDLEKAMERKRQNLYKRELEWIRRGAQARSTKQKARIQRFEEIKNSKLNLFDNKVEMSSASSRLGKKIINLSNISKSFDSNKLISDFSYTLLRDDRIGIVGKNGIGKSTLLNIITGNLTPDSGEIETGITVKVGYFSQESEAMDDSLRAIEYIKEGAEFVTTASGDTITASQMMENFLFDKEMQWTYIAKLSGGEKRRLFLLRILMSAPNILILDEPTNDLDLDTLKVLENYIDDFDGAVIAVSHDRYFLDRVSNRIFSFEGNAKILEHTGNYSDFVEFKQRTEQEIVKEKPTEEKKQREVNRQLKFSYKEKLEYESLEPEISKLEDKLEQFDLELEANSSDFLKLQEIMEAKEAVEEELLIKMERWEELSELAQKIEDQKKK